MARVIWTRHVVIEMVLSNPGSVPGGLKATEANYGNGWSCVDVAAEIIKRIQKQFPDAPDEKLRVVVEDNLRICFLKSPRGGQRYSNGGTLGLHCTFLPSRCITVAFVKPALTSCLFASWQPNISSLMTLPVTLVLRIFTSAILRNGVCSLIAQLKQRVSRHNIGIPCGRSRTPVTIAMLGW